MAINFKKIWQGLGIVPKTSSTSDSKGELEVIDSSGKLNYHNGTSNSPIVTEAHSATLTNKTIDADDNTISDLELDNLKAGVLNTSTSLASASNTQVPSALAVKTYVDNSSGAVQTDVDDLVSLSGVAANATTLGTFTGTIIPDNQTNKQAIQALETFAETDATNLANHISNATDAHDASAISVVPTGNLAADDVQEALVELQTDVDTRATSSALTAHTGASTNVHGLAVGSSVVGTTDSQVLTNKTITGADIRTPVRSDVKQDTKANLTTYAITASNGQLVFATDTKEMFQVVDGLLESVGGGEGIGGVDILFTQTFETAALADFTQTGLSLSTSAPLHGEVSALLTHQPATSQSFKQVIAVDRKFRSQSMVMRLNVKSNASAGNVVLNVYDETNAANLVASEQLQLSNDVNGEANSVGFTIPETCASLSYTITALQEAGSPVTRVDDIIAELAVTALLETSVEVPVVETQTSRISQSASFGNADITGAVTSSTGSGVYSYNSGTGVYTVIKNAQFDISATFRANGAASVQPLICDSSGSVEYATDTSLASAAARANASGSFYLAAGSTFKIRNALAGTTNEQYISVNAVYTSSTTKVIPLTQSGLVQNPDSMLRLNTVNGYGSTGTTVRRFSNIGESIGSDVLYVDSAVNGASFTILNSGTYAISYADQFNNNGILAITKNASSLSAQVQSLATSERLTISQAAGANFREGCAWTGYLVAGDVIRAQTDGNPSGVSPAVAQFTISKQSSLKQVTVNPNSKITLPSSEVRLQDCSARGSTNTGILLFGSTTNLRGDAFTIANSATAGSSITFTKAGKVDVTVTLYYSIANSEVYLSLNQSNLTSVPTSTEALAGESTSGNNDAFSFSWSGTVKVGDVLRCSSNNNPTANRNFMQVFHQELSVGVSVSNTLPQFSDSDSSVRVDTSNGYGSAGTKIRRWSNVRENIGVDVEYADSATNGSSFTAKSNGIYNVSFSANMTSGSWMGISKNASSLSTNVENLTAAERLAATRTATSEGSVAWEGYLVAGDIIRPHTDGTATGNAALDHFTISKVGKPNVTGVNVTPFVNIPSPNTTPWQPVTLTSTWTNLTLTGAARRNGDSMDLRVYGTLTGTPSGATLYIDMPTFNGAAIVVDSAKIPGAASNYVYVSSGFLRDAGTASYTPVMAIYDNTTRFGFNYGTALNAVNPTSPFTFVSGDFFNISIQGIPVVGWDVVPNQIVSAPETFSTDTASLTYAGSATYTLSTLANAPVGTFITFTKGSASNALTQTAAAPTQTTSDMNTNGILTMLGVTANPTTAAAPGTFAVQIGKGLKGVTANVYRLSGKTTAGAVFGSNSEGAGASGIPFTYNERTGILFLTTCTSSVSTVTSWGISFEDNTSAVNGTQVYVTFNASKSPALTGVPLLQPRIATLSDQKASGTSGPNSTAGTFVTRELNTLSDPSGIVTSLSSNQFNLPAGEYYVEASAPGHGNGPSTMGGHKIRIRNITDSTTSLVGSSERSTTVSGVGITTKTVISGVISISSSKVFELQHFAQSSATGGFGFAVSSGDPEVYSIVKITKIK